MGTVDTSFGSDQNGLVWGYRFSGTEPPRAVDCDAALSLMGQGSNGSDGFVWLHFSSSNVAAERWLRNHLELPDSFHEALHEGVGATRVEQDGDALVATFFPAM